MNREKREMMFCPDCQKWTDEECCPDCGQVELKPDFTEIIHNRVDYGQSDYTKLQEDLSKAVELLKEIADLEKYVKNKVTILGGVVSLANDFLNQLDKDKG